MRDLSADIDGLTADDAGLDSGISRKCRLREKQAAGGKNKPAKERLPPAVQGSRGLVGQAGFEPTTPSPQVRVSSVPG